MLASLIAPPSVLFPLLSLLPLALAQDSSHLVSSSLFQRSPGSSSHSKRHWQDDGTYNITFLHVNDVHARLDQYRSSGTDCPTDDPSIPCLAGYARILDKSREIRDQVPDSLFLNAGDEFQGTLFYSFYGWKKISETLNLLNFSLFTLGNHEFDAGPHPLTSFLESLNFPTISSNVHTSLPRFAKQLHPFWIFEEHELAVVALTTVDTPDISKPGKDVWFGEVESVQEVVDGLLEGRLGGKRAGKVKRVIALTHIGYEQDQMLARSTKNIHLIIGGHSHTPLGGEPWYSQGPYPTITKNLDNEEVFIVTSYRWGEHLGRIDVAFAPDSGKVLAYTGAPIRLTEEYPQDKPLQELITSWREPFEEMAKKVVGHTVYDLDQSTCQTKECTLGNAIADSMLFARRQQQQFSSSPTASSLPISFALTNSGGIRASLPAPNITQGQLITAFPFGSQLVDLHMTGRELWEMFEGVVSGVNKVGKTVTSSIQLSKNIHLTYDPSRPKGSRLLSLSIGSSSSSFSSASHGNELPTTNIIANATYAFTTLDFISTGGDSILPYPLSSPPPGVVSQDDAMRAWLKAEDPVEVLLEGRWEAGGESEKVRWPVGWDVKETKEEWEDELMREAGQKTFGEDVGRGWGGWRAWLMERRERAGRWA